MAQFEEYTERVKNRQKETFYIDQRKAELPDYDEDRMSMPYDADQLTEKMNRRMAETTWEERTAYYFTDTKVLQAKKDRYWRISQGTDNTRDGSAEELAEKYTNHSANKRRKRAREASECFEEAADLTEKLNKKQKGMTPGVLFREREKIMRLRMNGMLRAAEAKSKDDRHEAYLKYKAQVSCLTILHEQAERLLKQAGEEADQKSCRLLQAKSRDLAKELNKARNGMKKVVPSVEKTWQKEHGITDTAAGQRLREENAKNPDIRIEKEDVKLLMQLEALKKQKNMDYPCHMVRLDRNGQPINYAEKRKQDWNEAYKEAKEEKDVKQLEGAARDIILRVEQYPFPSFTDLEEKGSLALFREHPALYYEMFIQAPKYFRTEGKTNPILKSYEEGHPYFKAKRQLMDLLSRLMLQEMRKHHIDPENAQLLQPGEKEEKKESFGNKIRTAYRSMKKAAKERDDELRGGYTNRITRRARENELAEYRKINPSFTENQQQLLTELRSGRDAFSNHDFEKRTGAFTAKKRTGITYSSLLTPVMRMVHLDKGGKPLTEEDQKNLAHNEAWFKAIEEDDVEAQNTMIRQEFGSMFRDLEVPTGDQFGQWLQNKLEEDPAKLQELYLRLENLSYMTEENEAAREYTDTHPEFKHCYELLYPALKNLLQSGIGAKLAIRYSTYEELEPLTKEEQTEYKTQFRTALEKEEASYKEKYEKYFPGLADMKKENPAFNETDYRILQMARVSGATIPRYQEQLQAINEKQNKLDMEKQLQQQAQEEQAQEEQGARKQKPNWFLDQARNLSIGLHMYRTDEKGDPATKEDQKIKEKNQKWIDAWVEKDEKKISDILDRELEECYQGITMPEPEHLIEWLQDQVENHMITFNELMRRNVGVDNIKNATSDLRDHLDKYWKEHPQNEATAALLICISGYISSFYAKRYRIKWGNGAGSQATVMTSDHLANHRTVYDDKEDEMVADYRRAYDARRQFIQAKKQ